MKLRKIQTQITKLNCSVLFHLSPADDSHGYEPVDGHGQRVPEHGPRVEQCQGAHLVVVIGYGVVGAPVKEQTGT